MKTLTLLALLLVAAPAGAACPDACVATWGQPTTLVDGSPLTNLAGYRVYLNGLVAVEAAADSPSPTPESTATATLPALASGDHRVDVTAVNLAGSESEHSAPAFVSVAALPPPTDTVPPAISFGAVVTLGKNNRSVTVSASDASGLSRVNLTVNGATTTYLTNASGWSLSVRLPNSKTVTLTVAAIDAYGNTASKTTTVTK